MAMSKLSPRIWGLGPRRQKRKGKTAQPVAAANEENFRQLAEAMPQLVWTAEPDGKVDYYNIRHLEYEGIGRNIQGAYEWEPVLHPDDLLPTMRAWEQALSCGEMYQVEHRVRMKDGTYRWHLSRGVPAYGKDNRVIKWYGTATNIQAQKEIELALRKSEAEFRIFFELSNVGKIEYDPTKGRFTKVNQKYCEITGYSEEELLEMSFIDITHPDDRERDLEIYHAALRGETDGWRSEKRYVRKDGSVIFVEVLGSVFQLDSNQPPLTFAVVQDITERRNMQQTLMEYANRLEQSNQDLERFALIASHDLQEPLRKIKSFSDRVIAKIGSEIDDESRLYLDRMQDASRRMQIMIDGLLDLSKINQSTEPFVRVKLNEILETVVSDLESRINENSGQVIVGPLPEVRGDPVQMDRLFQNLIGNGLKYHSETVQPRVVVSSENFDPGWVKITVQDNGIGFDDTHAERIFQPFERLVGRTAYEGSGMGLAICKKIVERHGGSIRATSQLGSGSTFTVILPA